MNIRHFKIFSLLSTSCFLLGLGSCKKYLDQKPITAFGPDYVFNSVESARGAVVGTYNQLTGDNAYGIKLSLYLTPGGDETQGPTGAADGGRRDFPLYATTPGNTQMFSIYSQLFKGIQYANLCINRIPKMDLYTKGSDQQKKQLQRLYGEALTLRAQFYFEAVRNWGDLPLHFTVAEEMAFADPFPKRMGTDSIYAQLLNDLKKAAELVPWRNEITAIGDQQDERITKGTVKGLRARIALFRGGYSLRVSNKTMQRGTDYLAYYKIARDETNDIINSGQHSLNPSYKDLWKGQVGGRTAWDPNGELMFQVTAIGRTAMADTKLGYYNGPPVVDAATQATATGNSGVYILPTYFYLFDSTDTRRDVTCAAYSDTLAPDGVTFYKRGVGIASVYDGKYRRDWLKTPLPAGTYLNNFSGLKWQILRYADVLLMFAEAENELNGASAAAYNALNNVRRRAYDKAINTPDVSIDIPAGLSKDDFFKHLVRERALELGAEGIRKFDLIRWNLINTAINETKANTNKFVAGTGNGPLTQPSYMAAYPVYASNTASLPANLYYRSRTSADDLTIGGGVIVNSLYKTAPTATPAGTTRIAWMTAPTATTPTPAAVLSHYATNFVPNKSELLPIPLDAITAYGSFATNMPQNPNY